MKKPARKAVPKRRGYAGGGTVTSRGTMLDFDPDTAPDFIDVGEEKDAPYVPNRAINAQAVRQGIRSAVGVADADAKVMAGGMLARQKAAGKAKGGAVRKLIRKRK